MKKHTILNIDCTALTAEVLALSEINTDQEMPMIWFGQPDIWETIEPKLPSVQTTFASLNTEVDGISYRTVSGSKKELPMVIPVSHALLPVGDEPCIITLYDQVTGAQKIFYWFYSITDCTESETISFDHPILIGSEVPYTVTPVDSTKKINFITVRFTTTDVDALLAE